MRLIEVQISYRILMLFTILVLVISLLVYGVMRSPSFLEVKDPLEQADGILVLGGDILFLRTIQAVELYKKGYGKHLVITGCGKALGLQNQDNPFVLKRKAVAMGVPSKAILLVTESSDTYSDVALAKKIIAKNHFKRIILVTSPFHQLRAYLLAKKQLRDLSIKILNYPALDHSWNLESWWERANMRKVVLKEYKKIVGSWLLGWIGPLPTLSRSLTSCERYMNLSSLD